MEVKKIILLTNRIEEIKYLTDQFTNFSYNVVTTLKEIESFKYSEGMVLLSYNTNVIIPNTILNSKALCINVHAASPNFPGRDPHHWAIYRGAKEYGATIHFMTKFVDSGSIINTIKFSINNDDTPELLLQKANEKSHELIFWFLTSLSKKETICTNNEKWNGIKTTRKDLISMLDLTNVLEEKEFILRCKAFSISGHKNLYIQRSGFTFFLE